jgi:excisionase family DNA binding protein
MNERSSTGEHRRFLRVAEAARYIGVHPNTLRRWVEIGLVEGHRLPSINSSRRGEIRFKQSQLDLILQGAFNSTSFDLRTPAGAKAIDNLRHVACGEITIADLKDERYGVVGADIPSLMVNDASYELLSSKKH